MLIKRCSNRNCQLNIECSCNSCIQNIHVLSLIQYLQPIAFTAGQTISIYVTRQAKLELVLYFMISITSRTVKGSPLFSLAFYVRGQVQQDRSPTKASTTLTSQVILYLQETGDYQITAIEQAVMYTYLSPHHKQCCLLECY